MNARSVAGAHMGHPPPQPTGEKGLENRPGQNNCFLNVCIQALWHLDSFRSQFLRTDIHVHKGPSCIFCALKDLFTRYQFSRESVLPPTALRHCLSILYRDEEKFRVGDLDDAAEALDAILTSVNKVYLAPGTTETDETNPHSLANKVFGCPVLERIICSKCQAVSKPHGSDMFIYYLYATEIRQGRQRYPHLPFDALVKKLNDEERKSCPNEEKGLCKEKKCRVYKCLLQQPEVFTIGLVWVTPNPSTEEIYDTLSVISQRIRLSDIFEGVPVQFTYRLKGMICYYGLHYDCYFYNHQKKQWFVFDDTIVKEAGASWNQLVSRCVRGRFHPSVLFYERVEEGIPLPSSALKQSSSQKASTPGYGPALHPGMHMPFMVPMGFQYPALVYPPQLVSPPDSGPKSGPLTLVAKVESPKPRESHEEKKKETKRENSEKRADSTNLQNDTVVAVSSKPEQSESLLDLRPVVSTAGVTAQSQMHTILPLTPVHLFDEPIVQMVSELESSTSTNSRPEELHPTSATRVYHTVSADPSLASQQTVPVVTNQVNAQRTFSLQPELVRQPSTEPSNKPIDSLVSIPVPLPRVDPDTPSVPSSIPLLDTSFDTSPYYPTSDRGYSQAVDTSSPIDMSATMPVDSVASTAYIWPSAPLSDPWELNSAVPRSKPILPPASLPTSTAVLSSPKPVPMVTHMHQFPASNASSHSDTRQLGWQATSTLEPASLPPQYPPSMEQWAPPSTAYTSFSASGTLSADHLSFDPSVYPAQSYYQESEIQLPVLPQHHKHSFDDKSPSPLPEQRASASLLTSWQNEAAKRLASTTLPSATTSSTAAMTRSTTTTYTPAVGSSSSRASAFPHLSSLLSSPSSSYS
eukprot:TRINITY_DN4823_c0_g1_i1.p1 TRINITY_DN4823_c0_g1~~TRINITY_DN4823_c0_g1_i1.p1  ORF type:complete len:863 (-),score=74.65 TRINITY_DN4823_c0_g1_i1:81-2669(-)